MTETTIRDQVDEFNVGFNAQIGEELAAVFAGEQADLVREGIPTDTIAVGDRLPEVTVVTAEGDERRLADLLGAGPSVLIFYRGAWCPYCNIALRHYEATLVPQLAARGATLVAVSPQTPERSAFTQTSAELSFPAVSDPANTIGTALGIVTAPSAAAQQAHTALGFAVKDSNADDTPNVPFPTVLVLDSDGVVRFVDVHVDYTTRTETPEIVAALDELVAAAA